MSRAAASGILLACPGLLRTSWTTIALADLASCGTPPAERVPADGQAAGDSGGRNDDAAVKVSAEQRAMAKAEADIRDADRREAVRVSAGE